MDPIAEMFLQITNAQMAGKDKLTVPFSKIKMAILAILKGNKKIADFSQSKEPKDAILIKLSPEAWLAKRISKPGKRVYSSNGHIPRPKTFRSLLIISTPEGVMAGEEARQKGLGGEIIAEIS
jgi:small subunit ribosomal protein S8